MDDPVGFAQFTSASPIGKVSSDRCLSRLTSGADAYPYVSNASTCPSSRTSSSWIRSRRTPRTSGSCSRTSAGWKPGAATCRLGSRSCSRRANSTAPVTSSPAGRPSGGGGRLRLPAIATCTASTPTSPSAENTPTHATANGTDRSLPPPYLLAWPWNIPLGVLLGPLTPLPLTEVLSRGTEPVNTVGLEEGRNRWSRLLAALAGRAGLPVASDRLRCAAVPAQPDALHGSVRAPG